MNERAQVRRIIFLDIDGVLTTFRSNDQLDPVCITELDWLIDTTGAEVILTSSWRDSIGLAATRRRLAAAGFRGKIARAAPPLAHGSRSDEIDAVLASLAEEARFAILDDVPVAKHLRRNLVLVDEFAGLTGLDVTVASRILKCHGGER